MAGSDQMQHLRSLFDLIELPPMGPVHFAIALPNRRLMSLPEFPPAALPTTGRVASGRGLSKEQAEASALGEAAELVSCCAWGDEELITARDDELGPAAISPEALNGWSDEQIDDRDAWNARFADYDWRPPRRDPKVAIDWLKVHNALDGTTAYLPADFAFIGRKQPGDPSAVAIGDSNGCASGIDAESAKLAAVLELVERDATGRWWYGRQQRPPIDLASLEDMSGLVAWLDERQRRTWLFDITTRPGIPVFAAASAEPNGRDVALGFAASIDARAAAAAAITEMAQMEVSLNAARMLGPGAGHWNDWRAEVQITTSPLSPTHASRRSCKSASTNAVALSAVMHVCASQATQTWIADMTRSIIKTPTVRAIATAFRHYKPRFVHASMAATRKMRVQIPLLT